MEERRFNRSEFEGGRRSAAVRGGRQRRHAYRDRRCSRWRRGCDRGGGEGRRDAYAVFRLAALNDVQRAAVAEAARRQMGKPSDYFLRRTWEQLYSSELVRLAYSDIGFDLGRLQKIGKVGDLTTVRSLFQRKWQSNEDCRKRRFDAEQCWAMLIKQEVVTPASIVADAHMTKIFEVKAPEHSVTLTSMTQKSEGNPAP
jgi:hypothetical protein